MVVEDLSIEAVSGGLTNRLFRVLTGAKVADALRACGSPTSVIVRVYGVGTESFIDREREVTLMCKLFHSGLGSPVYSTFANGFVYGFISGRTLETEDMRNPVYGEKIGRLLARWHVGQRVHHEERPDLFLQARTYLSLVPDAYKSAERTALRHEKLPSVDVMKRELDQLAVALSHVQSPLVNCHGDLLAGNMIYDKTTDVLSFVDFEYSRLAPRGYDIGNHLWEWCGFYPADFGFFPWDFGKAERLLKSYAAVQLGLVTPQGNGATSGGNNVDGASEDTGKVVVSEMSIEVLAKELHAEALAMSLVSLVDWTIWAMVQEDISDIDGNYLEYAIMRWENYEAVKLKCLDAYPKARAVLEAAN